MDGVLAATFVYPLCVDKAVEVGNRMLHEANFHPEKQYDIPSKMVTAANAPELYQRLTLPGIG
jgi:ribose transport system substrate-binding protein